MSRIPFNSVGGFSVGTTGQYVVIDPAANISASGGTFSGNVVIGGNLTVKNVVSSVNGFTGAVSITSGSNVTITQAGNLITIASSGGGGNTGPTGPAGATGAVKFAFSSTPPAGPTYGDQWYDSENGVLFVYINDGDSSQWIDVAGSIVGGITSYVSTVNGVTGPISIVQGTNVTVSTVGNTITISSSGSGSTNVPIATASITGVASFGNEFLVSAAGAVSLTANYVKSFNGATGAVTYSPVLATSSLTGVASFNNDFIVSAAGSVSLTGNVVRSFNGSTGAVSYSPVIASSSLTGVASFGNEFLVSAAGAVSLTANYVKSFNGTTGAVSYSPVIATSSLTGVASFTNDFLVSAAGAVSLTGNVVRSFNGSTGAVSYAPPLATTSITGVASFNTSDFTVTTGAVSLSNVARTNSTNTFTGLQTFNAGITAQSLFVSQGATFGSRVSANSGITAQSLYVSQGATFGSSLYVSGNTTLGGATTNITTMPSGQVIKTYSLTTSATTQVNLATESMAVYSSADILVQAEKYDLTFPLGTLGTQNTRIQLVANPSGTLVNHTQYSNIYVGQTAASYDVDTNGVDSWRLRVTPNSTYTTIFRVYAILSPNLGGSGA